MYPRGSHTRMPCSVCKGTGKVDRLVSNKNFDFVCPRCKGLGVEPISSIVFFILALSVFVWGVILILTLGV